MKRLAVLNSDKIIILGLVLVSLLKFADLSGGFVLAEPDTVTHIEIVNNFRDKLYPMWSGLGWYFGLPLYMFLGYLVDLVLNNTSLSLIVVSILASIGLNLGIYCYVARKINRTAALFAALAFLLSPSAIFYSRMGLIEMTVMLFAFLFLFLFDLGVRHKNWKLIILGGISLGAGILTKYTALIFCLVPVIYFAFELLKNLVIQKTKFVKKLSWLTFPFWSSVLTGVLAIIIPLPVVAYFLIVDPIRFKLLTKASVLESPEFWGPVGIHFYFSEYAQQLSFLVGSVMLIAALLGIGYIYVEKKSEWVLFLTAMLTAGFFVVKRNPYPRYFVILIPFFAILAGLGSYFLYKLITFNLRGYKAINLGGCLLLFVLLSIHEAYYSFASANHQLVEDTANYLKKVNTQSKPVFSTYWPNLFAYAGTGERTSWLTDSAWDVGAFGKNWPEGLNSLQVLIKEGGYVIIEDRYSNYLWDEMDRVAKVTSNVRKQPSELIAKTKEPIMVIKDNRPNFPYFSNTWENTIKIYEYR